MTGQALTSPREVTMERGKQCAMIACIAILAFLMFGIITSNFNSTQTEWKQMFLKSEILPDSFITPYVLKHCASSETSCTLTVGGAAAQVAVPLIQLYEASIGSNQMMITLGVDEVYDIVINEKQSISSADEALAQLPFMRALEQSLCKGCEERCRVDVSASNESLAIVHDSCESAFKNIHEANQRVARGDVSWLEQGLSGTLSNQSFETRSRSECGCGTYLTGPCAYNAHNESYTRVCNSENIIDGDVERLKQTYRSGIPVSRRYCGDRRCMMDHETCGFFRGSTQHDSYNFLVAGRGSQTQFRAYHKFRTDFDGVLLSSTSVSQPGDVVVSYVAYNPNVHRRESCVKYNETHCNLVVVDGDHRASVSNYFAPMMRCPSEACAEHDEYLWKVKHMNSTCIDGDDLEMNIACKEEDTQDDDLLPYCEDYDPLFMANHHYDATDSFVVTSEFTLDSQPSVRRQLVERRRLKGDGGGGGTTSAIPSCRRVVHKRDDNWTALELKQLGRGDSCRCPSGSQLRRTENIQVQNSGRLPIVPLVVEQNTICEGLGLTYFGTENVIRDPNDCRAAVWPVMWCARGTFGRATGIRDNVRSMAVCIETMLNNIDINKDDNIITCP